MPALIWSNTANPAFLLQLLDYFLDAGTTQSKRIHHFLSGYSRFLPNHLQYFLPTFLLTLPRTLHPSFGQQRDDGDKGVSFNELGLGALGVQGQVLAYVQDTRPKFLTRRDYGAIPAPPLCAPSLRSRAESVVFQVDLVSLQLKTPIG